MNYDPMLLSTMLHNIAAALEIEEANKGETMVKRQATYLRFISGQLYVAAKKAEEERKRQHD